MSTDAPLPPSQSQEPIANSTEVHDRPNRDLKNIVSGDPEVRKVIAEELLAAIANEHGEIKQRARQLFIEHGYFDEAIRHLREARDVNERAAAADTLGQFGSELALAPLNAALFDEATEVRAAVQLALERITKSPAAVSDKRDSDSDSAADSSIPSTDPSVDKVTALQSKTANVPELPPMQISEAGGADVHRLRLEENEIRQTLDGLEAHFLELDAALRSAKAEAHSATEGLLKFRNEIIELRSQEEHLHRQAEAATSRYETELQKKAEAERDSQRFAEESAHVQSEIDRITETLLQVARQRAEISTARRDEAENARRLADDLYNVEMRRLRSEETALRQAAEKAASRRAEVQRARRAVEEQSSHLLDQQTRLGNSEAARLAEIERVHYEAEQQYRSEQEQLRLSVEKLNQINQYVAARRASVEFATRVAEVEAAKLEEERAQLEAAEELRRRAEADQLKLKERLSEELAQEREGIADLPDRLQPDDDSLLATGRSGRQFTGKVAIFPTQVPSFPDAHNIESAPTSDAADSEEREIELRSRIEQAELRRRASQESCLQLEERAVKVEAEAHRSRLEEEQALAKLENARREAAAEFQARVDQQKRIQEEIEQLRQLELEERRRVEAEVLRRSQVEARLQQERERFKAEEAARLRVEAAEGELLESSADTDERVVIVDDDPEANPQRRESETTAHSWSSVYEVVESTSAGDRNNLRLAGILTLLRSEDIDQRATALAELAGFDTDEALAMIVEAFDDQSPEVRSSAALALRSSRTLGAVEWFTRAFEEGSVARKRNIGQAIVDSGLAMASIEDLSEEDRDNTYAALTVLLVMARAGELQPLVQAIERHKNLEVRRAAIRLLTLSGQADVADAAVKRRLAGLS